MTLKTWVHIAQISSAIIASLALAIGIYQYYKSVLRQKRAELLSYEGKVYELKNKMIEVESEIERAELIQKYLFELQQKNNSKIGNILRKLALAEPGILFDIQFLSVDELAHLARVHMLDDQYRSLLFQYLLYCDKIIEFIGVKTVKRKAKDELVYSYIINALNEYGDQIDDLSHIADSSGAFKNLRDLN
ncbi:MAG: hypothetical protein ACOCZ8_01895 [Bacteroidota bacterium]